LKTVLNRFGLVHPHLLQRGQAFVKLNFLHNVFLSLEGGLVPRHEHLRILLFVYLVILRAARQNDAEVFEPLPRRLRKLEKLLRLRVYNFILELFELIFLVLFAQHTKDVRRVRLYLLYRKL
jgi:hypothetical protein